MYTGKTQSEGATNENADETGVVVCEDDFYSALSHLVPSLSAAEQQRYDTLQDMFTQRHHSNSQLQQPATVSALTDS